MTCIGQRNSDGKGRGNTKARGKGPGLYLVKKLVDDYHGAVWVEDRVPGDYAKGAKFVIMLPVAV